MFKTNMAVDDKFRERVAEVLREELTQPEKVMWLSFADEGGFRGVIIIKAHGIADALTKCNVLGINPGGQVAGHEIPDEYALNIKADEMNKCLTKEYITKRFNAKSQKEIEEENVDDSQK
jgi:hypothetical protein